MSTLLTASPIHELPLSRIFKTWWPLAASWLLMGIELPAVSAVMARLPNPTINLAAYGGVVFPLALIIEAPIIMLLAASTTLCKDIDAYAKVRKFMMVMSACLTALHLLIAFTPLYYFIVEEILGAPQVIVEPARIGLMIMTPWTWSIAYRRFNQGVLIRFGHSQTVGVGTVIRLSANLIVLITGLILGNIPGIVVGTSAVIAGVLCEAIYSGIVVRPVIATELSQTQIHQPLLTRASFLNFYTPLAMTSLFLLLANPIGSAAVSRMPEALASLAVWPVVNGLIFMFRSLGVAYNEVVIALLDKPRSSANLRRYTIILSIITTGSLLVITITPLSFIWFTKISALSPELSLLAQKGLWLALPLPALSVWQSWYQGAILHGKQTRSITEAVIIYLATSAIILGVGVIFGNVPGLYYALFSLSLSTAAQTIWLLLRSQPVLRNIYRRDGLLGLE